MPTIDEYLHEFNSCSSPHETNLVYKANYWQAADDRTNRDNLMEAHRRSLERFVSEGRTESSTKPKSEVRGKSVRNWAVKEGIPVPKRGKVNMTVENAYREAHGLTVLEGGNAPTVKLADLDVSAADVRQWAREHNVQVGARGRIHPNVVKAYLEGTSGQTTTDA